MPDDLLLVNMVPQALSGETNQDSEPMLAVNASNPSLLAGTAFTPDPMGGPLAPIYISTDGGRTWTLNSIVPSQEGVSLTGDITIAFGPRSHDLYAGILRFPAPPGDTRLNVLPTRNFRGSTPMKVLLDRDGSDQPFIQASLGPSRSTPKDSVFLGNNDFNQAPETTTVDFSLNPSEAAATFKSARLDSRASAGQNGPQVRPACHPDGVVYVAYYGWRQQSGNFAMNTLIVTADVVVVRDDAGASGTRPFRALVDSDRLPGKIVARGVRFPFRAMGKTEEGQQRLGGDLSLAVDPRESRTIYIAYTALRSRVYTLHVRRSLDSGQTWSADLLTAPRSTNPALAINSDGVVGLLYQQLTGSGTGTRWVTHFRRRAEPSGTWDDRVLATTSAVKPVKQFDPYLGDYDHLTSVGKDFFGIFSASNQADPANFPNGVAYQRNHDFAAKRLLDLDGAPVAVSIDPFFFKVAG